jgi:hypothetical protein
MEKKATKKAKGEGKHVRERLREERSCYRE